MLGGHHLTVGNRRAPSVASDRMMSADRWPAMVAGLRPEVVNSAFGTTIAKAGSRQAFAAIDHDTNIAVAPAAKTAGARQFLMVSSAPARSRSTNFYIATKRPDEMCATALGSERLDIFRPRLLVSQRTHDSRLTERLGILVRSVDECAAAALL